MSCSHTPPRGAEDTEDGVGMRIGDDYRVPTLADDLFTVLHTVIDEILGCSVMAKVMPSFPVTVDAPPYCTCCSFTEKRGEHHGDY